VRVFFGSLLIVRLRLAAFVAFLMFRLAADRCFRVAIRITSQTVAERSRLITRRQVRAKSPQ